MDSKTRVRERAGREKISPQMWSLCSTLPRLLSQIPSPLTKKTDTGRYRKREGKCNLICPDFIRAVICFALAIVNPVQIIHGLLNNLIKLSFVFCVRAHKHTHTHIWTRAEPSKRTNENGCCISFTCSRLRSTIQQRRFEFKPHGYDRVFPLVARAVTNVTVVLYHHQFVTTMIFIPAQFYNH